VAAPRRSLRYRLAVTAAGLLAVVLAAAYGWRDDIVKALLDPKVPFVKDTPPPAPNYAVRGAWALAPAADAPSNGAADVFFIHPTTYNGGKHWNGPISDRASNDTLMRVILPNYAEPFAGLGDVFAPRYRQASLYTKSTLWDDALDARRFAYGDVKAAFDFYRDRLNQGRPFVLVGVEQGGELGARLLREEIAPDPALRARLVAAYLIDTMVPADEHSPTALVPACERRDEAGCLVAWAAVRRGDVIGAVKLSSRAMVWSDVGQLVPLGRRPAVCVNPLTGSDNGVDAPARLNLGAAAATGLEWGVRPGFMSRQVGAQCVDGILRLTSARSDILHPSGDWVRRYSIPGYNLFWADLEADSQARMAAWQSAHPAAAPPPARQSNSS
jgi:hypothetical protein